MNVQISQLVHNMNESATIKMAQAARDLRAQGAPIINLSLGEPDFDTPNHIKQAAVDALAAGYTKYPPVPGIPELRQAICDKFKQDNQLDYEPNQIVVSNGAKQSIANLCLSTLNPGDEVIIFSPYWVSYIEIVKMTGAKPIELYAGIEQDYKVSAQQVREALTDKTRLLLFSSPCNPTGSVFSAAELESIADVLKDWPNVFVISDEIYEYIRFDGEHTSIAQVAGMQERTAVVNGFSKGFSMTGWRLGYVAAPLSIAKACAKIQGQFTSGANSFGQKAAVTALQADRQPTRDMVAAFRRRRQLCLDLLSDIPGIKANEPEGAFYIFPDISAFFGSSYEEYEIQNADDFCLYLLQEANVALVTGAAFGSPDCVRISYAASDEQLTEAIRRIREALLKLT